MAKRTITMKVREMRDADVQWISLVNRPASRIPFRVTKNEGKLEAGMIHLNRMFKKEKTEKTNPGVAAFLIQKSDQDTVMPRLKEAGFKTEDIMEQDGVLVVKQDAEFNESECVAVQLNDRVGAMLSHVQKAFTPYREDSTDFNENLRKYGFYPSVNVAMGTLDETVLNALMDADTVAEASTSISEALEQFSGYIATLVDNLPEEAFTAMKLAFDTAEKSDSEKSDTAKADDTEASKSEKPEDKAEGQESGEASKSEGAEDNANEESSAAEKAEGDSGEEAEKSEAKSDTPEAAVKDEDTGKAQKGEDGLATKMDSILEAVGALTTQMGSLEKSQGELSTRVESVDRVAKAAREAVEGTVSAGEEDDHQTPVQKTARKGDKDFWGGTGLDNLIQL